MDKLNRDELFLIAIELDTPQLLKFCASSKFINEKVCKKDDIWIYKLRKEYSLFGIKNLKETYIVLEGFRNIGKIIKKKYPYEEKNKKWKRKNYMNIFLINL